MSEKDAEGNWLNRNWHALCGIVYLVICLSDFVLMPSFYEMRNVRENAQVIVGLALKFPDGATQITALNTLREQRTWQPITLAANGLFHLTFGAILGVGVWARSRNDMASSVASAVMSQVANGIPGPAPQQPMQQQVVAVLPPPAPPPPPPVYMPPQPPPAPQGPPAMPSFPPQPGGGPGQPPGPPPPPNGPMS